MPIEEDDAGGSDPNEPNPTPNTNADPSGDTSPGKHLVLMVPDFKNGVGAPMVSYLRLGDAHSQAGPAVTTGPIELQHGLRGDLGEDLASLVQGFTDDMRDRAGGSPAVPAQAATPDTTDADGNVIPGSPAVPAIPAQAAPELTNATPPNSPSTSLDMTDARRQESALLHTKGGWRDHSDGNRITTTRGDKIEVIRGNYKMLVLGRSDPPAPLVAGSDGYVDTSGWGNVTGVEMAGGNVDTADLAYGSSADPTAGPPGSTATPPTDPSRLIALQTTFEWNKDIDGNWAWKQTTNVGSPTVPFRPPGGGNNQIISNTWVDYQETNLGSAAKPVSNIVSSTYASEMTQTTTVNGPLNQWTNAGDLRNGVVAGNSIDNTTSAPTINTATAAGLQATTQAVMFNFVGNLFGASAEVDVAAVLATLQVAVAAYNILIIPIVLDDHQFTHVDMHPGAHIDMHTGVHFDVHSGTHPSIDATPLTITGTSVQVSAAHTFTIAGNHLQVAAGTVLTSSEAAIVNAANTYLSM